MFLTAQNAKLTKQTNAMNCTYLTVTDKRVLCERGIAVRLCPWRRSFRSSGDQHAVCNNCKGTYEYGRVPLAVKAGAAHFGVLPAFLMKEASHFPRGE